MGGPGLQDENSPLERIRVNFLTSSPEERTSLCHISAVLEMNLDPVHTKPVRYC